MNYVQSTCKIPNLGLSHRKRIKILFDMQFAGAVIQGAHPTHSATSAVRESRRRRFVVYVTGRSLVEDEQFFANWDGRIGHDAALLLRKRARWMPVFLADFVAIVVLAQVLNGSAYYLSAGLVLLLLFVELWYFSARTNRRLAAALSQHLGFKVGGLPSFRTVSRYDDWLADRQGSVPYREKRIFGGFILLRRPPKH